MSGKIVDSIEVMVMALNYSYGGATVPIDSVAVVIVLVLPEVGVMAAVFVG